MPDTSFHVQISRKNAAPLWLLALVFCLAHASVSAQTWLRFYPTYGFNIAHGAVAPNGDHIVGGVSIESGQTSNYFFLHRNDSDGNPLWSRAVSFPGQTDTWCTFVEKCPGGGIVAGGAATISGRRTQAVFRLSDVGDTLWTRTFWTDYEGILFSATPMPDGNLLLAGNRRQGTASFSSYSPTLMKVNAVDGSVIWSNYYPHHANNEFGGGALIAPDGSILHTSSNDTAFVRRLDADGNLLWERAILPIYFSDYGILRRALADGFTLMQRWGADMLFRRFDYDGNIISSKIVPNMGYSLPASTESDSAFAFALGGFFSGTDTFPEFRKMDFAGNPSPRVWPLAGMSTNLIFWAQTIEAAPDGGYYISGNVVGRAAFFVLKVDADGHFDAGNLTGNVFRDNDLDCLESPGEPGLQPIVVQATDLDFGNQWFETTDSSGHFVLRVPLGDYQVEAIAPGGASDVWQACPPQSVALSSLGDSVAVPPLGLKPLLDCPFLQLDLAAGLIRPCSTTVLIVNVLNAGTADADSATVMLEFDPLLTFDSSSLAPIAQNGNLLWFDAGALASLGSTSFQLFFTVDCNAPMGQLVCLEGHVSPDSLCAPQASWDGSELKVNAFCDGDTTRFQVSNIGTGNMGQASELVIIEDYIILRSVPLQLSAGQDSVISQPNPDDKTHYARIEQSPNFPGDAFESDGVDYCTGTGTPGMLLQYPFYRGSVFDASYCDEVRTSYDPNDKRGFPLGYGPTHFIERGTPLRYMIRFQNTGNDTAFNIVVRDTLPAQLDLASLRIGGASHPFNWEMSGQGVLIFKFANILLPDSTTNEAASHGFVQFFATPKSDLQPGTLLQNRAAIYFDFNAPVITDWAWHTVDSNFIPVGIFAAPERALGLSVSPNPASDAALLELASLPPGGFPLTLTVFDVFGKKLRQEPIFGKKHTLRRADLPPGLCFLKIENEKGGVVAAGKLLWKLW